MTIKVLLADDHRVITDGLRSLIDSHADMRAVALAANGVEAGRCMPGGAISARRSTNRCSTI